MKALRATLAALLVMAMMAFPAFAQDGKTGAGDDQQIPDNQQSGGGKGTVTKTFELTLNGTVPADRAFGVAFGTLDQFESDQAQDVIFCGQPDPQAGDVVVSDEDCVGGGNTYTYSAEFAQGTELYFTYITAVEGDEENTIEFFFGNFTFEGPGDAEVLNADMTNHAFYTFGKGTGAGDEQETPDNQQEGDKDAGAGDDQQDGRTGAGKTPDNQQTGGGKTPDNQQGGGGDTVTKTFELTVNGDVPADAAFVVGYLEEGEDPDTGGHFVILCGDIGQIPEEDLEGIPAEDIISDEPCGGNGAVHSFEREFAQGTGIAYFFARASVTDEEVFEVFHTSIQGTIEDDPGPEDFETLDTDMTNTAWYTFGKGTGAGDEQETPDNQQDDAQDDVQDDQQGEMPDELPDTGAGGLAGGLPLGPAAGASLLAASGYVMLRRR